MPHCRSIALCAAGLLLGAAVLAAGCGDSKSKDFEQSQQPTKVLVNVPGTDAVVLPMSAALAGDPIELARLTGYTQVACTTTGSAQPPAPSCPDGTADGTKVDSLALLGCQGSWIGPELVPDAYRSADTGHPKLFAVYRPKRAFGVFGAELGVEQVVVVQTDKRPDGTADGFALHIKHGRVVLLQNTCDAFLKLVDSAVVDSYIVDPANAPTTTP